MAKEPIYFYLSAFILLGVAASVNAELNINLEYEKFTANGGETNFFGASLALHHETIYAGAPGNTGIYICEKGDTSCSEQDDFDDVEKTSMLGISMGVGEDKIFTCAPRTDLDNFAKQNFLPTYTKTIG